MKIALDTNILVRILVNDDVDQTRAATVVMARATLIALPLPALCEAAWVLGSRYGIPKSDIATGLQDLSALPHVITDMAAVSTGLAFLRAGGDFADGVIAHQGRELGADILVSFDSKARTLWQKAGGIALNPSQA